MNKKKYSSTITFRLFDNEKQIIDEYVDKVKDSEGFRKYESESHFIRCAIIKLINTEKQCSKLETRILREK